MNNMTLGYIGLGKMGLGMVQLLLEKGYTIHATDPSDEARNAATEVGATVYSSAPELVSSLGEKKTVWMMVPHAVVDSVIEEILPELNAGDIVIDGGNSNYKLTMKRAADLEQKGVMYIDAGVSGGPSGARNGACVMVGGKKEVYDQLEALFKDIAAPEAYGYFGKSGAGHFVKMVHNGIEYGMMQAIGEGFDVMKQSEFDLDLREVSRVYNKQSVIESRLVGWLESAYDEYGVELEPISGKVKHSGEGLWTVEAAKELGVPVDIIEGSLDFRVQSQENPSYTGQVVSALRNQFGGHEVKKENE